MGKVRGGPKGKGFLPSEAFESLFSPPKPPPPPVLVSAAVPHQAQLLCALQLVISGLK